MTRKKDLFSQRNIHDDTIFANYRKIFFKYIHKHEIFLLLNKQFCLIQNDFTDGIQLVNLTIRKLQHHFLARKDCIYFAGQ